MLVLLGVGIIFAAEPDSVYTNQIVPWNIIGKYFVPMVPTHRDSVLNLLYWRFGESARTVIDTVAPEDSTYQGELEETAEKLDLTPYQLELANRFAAAFLPARLIGRNTGSEINSSTGSITLYDEYDGFDLRLPSTAALDWYINSMSVNRLQQLKRNKLTGSLQSKAETTQLRRSQGIELVGGNIAGQRVSLSVSGNVVLSGGMKFKKQTQQQTAAQARRNWELDINQTQRFDIEGNIGDRVSVKVHQDSESDFEWENDMKIAYRGEEDEILKSIDAGNISLSLPGTRYAAGSGGSSQGLFGVKAVSQFGPLNLTTVASIERSKKSTKSNALSQAYSVSEQNYLRRRYFFIDTEFRSNYYPLTTDGRHLVYSTHVVADLELYISTQEASDTYPGKAYVDPAQPNLFESSTEQGHFKRLILNQDYSVDPQLGWVRLNMSASDNDIIAVAYAVGIQQGADSVMVIDRVGDIDRAPGDTTDLTLKLIKGIAQTPNSPTWPLEFKNVYSLGGIGINAEGFEVKIVDRQGATASTDRASDGRSFLQIFGLDRQDETQNPNPDEIIDVGNSNIVKLGLGELHFPALLPFAFIDTARSGGLGIGGASHDPALNDIYANELEDLDQDFRRDTYEGSEEQDFSLNNIEFDEVDGDRLHEDDLNGDGKINGPAFYYSSNTAEKNRDSRFDIEVKQSSKGASVYNLGFNMVPGSETVRVNGNVLTPGTDYDLDSFTGTLTIKDMSAYADPEVIIDYEENVLISFDKKVMLGTRAELELGENSFLGATALYYNQSIVDERIDVGSEPIQNVLWDVNGRFKRDVPLLTRLVDRLPIIQTDVASKIEIEGELAQVHPNPNPLGVGYVDDFEAAKRVTSPSLRFNAWRPSSAPVDKDQSYKRKMSWWNPDGDYLVKAIWPQKNTSTRANNLTTTVMVLDALFDNGTGSTADDSLWSGITYPLYASEYDQTRTKFLEIWLNGVYGKMHVDLGIVSEDVNGNGIIDTEDKPVAGFNEGNGIVDPGEDVGLDGCADEYEDGLGGCLDENGPPGPYDEAGNPDPNGDNYLYERRLDRMDFVNGTEGNQNGIAQGAYPDSEDLNGNGSSFVDARNDYFSINFNLDENHIDTRFVGGRTAYDDGTPTGWRLYRLPLSDFTIGSGTPDWNNIQHMRIWIDSVGVPNGPAPDINGRIEIAKIEFVGNEWQELGQAPPGTENYVNADSAAGMAVTVANTEDNADYRSPPNISGEYDRLNDIKLREQSLVLDFSHDGIAPGFKAALQKSVPKQEGTFLVYGTMEMFVHAEVQNGVITPESSPVTFWFRLGHGLGSDDQYYEIRKKIYPGWDEGEDRNRINFKLDEMAKIKLRESPDTVLTVQTGDIFETIPGYQLHDMMVYVRGEPSLERIKQYTVGVINEHDDQTIFGKVMIDDLRLLDVHREKGVAFRLNGKLNLADLMSTSFGYERKDADFHQLQEKTQPNANTVENIMANATLQTHRLLPQKWGLKLPVTVSYSKSLSSPKYYPGRDVLAGDLRSAPDSIQSISNSLSLKTSFDKTSRSRNWLMRQSLDRLTGSVSYTSKSSSTKEIQNSTNTNLNTQLGYPIKFSEENYFMPFAKLEKVPILGKKFKEMRIYYTPSNLDFSGNLVETVNQRTTRAKADTTIENYGLSLKRAVKSTYLITDKITANYSWNASSTLDHLRWNKIDALKRLDTGINLDLAETFSTTYNPNIFTWLQPKLTYQSRYNWVKNRPIDEPQRGGRISNSGRLGANVNLELKKIIETVYSPTQTAGQSTRRGRRGRSTTPEEEKPKKEIKNPQLKAFLKALHGGSSKISPIALTYAYNRSAGEPAAIGQPGLNYRMALTSISGLPADSLTTQGINLSTLTQDRSVGLRSGINPVRNINITFSHTQSWRSTESSKANTSAKTVTFLMLGTDDKVGVPFINWGLRWSNLENLPILKLLKWKVSLDHQFSGDRSTGRQNDKAGTEKYKRSFSPLVGLTMNFDNGITANARMSVNNTLARDEAGDAKTAGTQMSAALSYMRRGGINLPLPFLKDLNLQNSVNFSLDFVYSNNIAENRRGTAKKFAVTKEGSSWSITPRITYTFSTKVTGTIRYSYGEDKDNFYGTRIVRDFGFDVNIAIRGN
ncbi:cell surface protein SprA [Candidatus Neomarinimicrobiota bacterium]